MKKSVLTFKKREGGTGHKLYKTGIVLLEYAVK